MDSPQSVVSPFKNLSVSEPVNLSNFLVRNSDETKGPKTQKEESEYNNLDGFIGILEVYVHQARDIQNICIYHKQDVYAKLCLTSDPENTVSTKIINGGGQNPIFDDTLRLNVRTVDSSVKCEIWMMSRVRNYLEDQLLGFALVPMSNIFVSDGKLHKEFTLSSTDLFHSPSGFVQLSLSYSGAAPDMMKIPSASLDKEDSEITESETSDFSNIEFPDPKVANENELMVSEYFSIPCSRLDTSDNVSFSMDTTDLVHFLTQDSPVSNASTNGSFISENGVEGLKSHKEEVSEMKEKKNENGGDDEVDLPIMPVLTVDVGTDTGVVQEDIVNMYLKSMREFTDSLEKMKLPMGNIDVGLTSSPENSSTTDQNKSQASKGNGSARVFYGSRAFF